VIADRYRPIEQIGAGGMATVWKAEDTVLGRHVAIKRLLPHLADDPAASERFAREARAAAKLSHPGIVTVFDTGEDADGPYIVLELITGETASAQLARSGPMGPQEAGLMISQVAAALDHAHAAGVIHRDIKPANLIIEPDGRVRLADFGIARTLDDRATITGSGELVGTISYLAPEILRGEPATPSSDIYGLGAVTYELISGRPPFSADSPAALLEAVRSSDVPSLDGLAPDPISTAVGRAMARAPEDRPDTAGAFAAELVGSTTLVMAAAPVPGTVDPAPVTGSEDPTVVQPATPPPPPPPPRAPTRSVAPARKSRPRSPVWPLLLLLVTLVGLAAAAILNGRDGEPGAATTVVTTVPPAPTTVAPSTTIAPTTTVAPTTTLAPTTTTPVPTPESVAGEIGLLLASLEPPDFKNKDVRRLEDRVEKALEEWQAGDREELRHELERAFEDAGNFEESPERSLLLERLAQLSELMGFRVEGLGNGQGNEGGDGDG
jgi:serine/threonine-protein kinase